MQVSYNREVGRKGGRKLTLQLSADDVDALPETLRQEFARAEIALLLNRPASLVSVWSRILGLRPKDLQGDLFEGEGADVFTPPEGR
jgi:hypothetical protein